MKKKKYKIPSLKFKKIRNITLLSSSKPTGEIDPWLSKSYKINFFDRELDDEE